MFFVRLCLFVCVDLFLYAKCSIPVEKLCVNPTCKEPISKAQGVIKYTPSSREVLAFNKGQEIIIVSKSKNKDDYWGAIIKGKSGYVPSKLVQEVKIFHSENDLIPVTVEPAQHVVEQNNTLNQENDDKIEMEKINVSQPVESVVGVPNSPNILESPIKPDEPFKVIEGTTIYPDEVDEIKPSTTMNMNSAAQTVDPVNSNINSQHDSQERVTVPPEIINLNSNYKAQSMQNVTAFTIENVKENDENTIVESRDIDDEDDEDDAEEEDDAEGDEEDEEGDELPYKQENSNNHIPVNKFHDAKESSNVVGAGRDDSNTKINKKLEEVRTESTNSVSGSTERVHGQTAPIHVQNSVTTDKGSDDNSNMESQTYADSLHQHSHQNVAVNKVDGHTEKPHNTQSMLNAYPELNTQFQPAAEGFQVKYGTPQPIMSGPPQPASASPQSQSTPEQTHEMPPITQIKAQPTASPTSGEDGGMTASHELNSVATPQNITDENTIHSVTPSPTEEVPAETLASTPASVASDTSTIFSQASVSAEELSNNVPEIIGEKVEVTTEAFATPQPIPSETPNQFSESTQTWEYLTAPENIPPDTVKEEVEVATEPAVTPSVPLKDAKEESKVVQVPEQDSQADIPSNENVPEEPGTLSHVVGMFSSWFTSAPESGQPEVNHEGFPDIQSEEEQIATPSEPPTGECGKDCEDSYSQEEASSWSGWIPSGLAVENIMTGSNTFAYLVVTAVTVLLFTLGHNLIEKRGKTGPLIAKINKLEHELLVSSKECLMLKDEIQSFKDKVTLYENSANDELVLSLQAELEESKKVRSELESSIEVLQQELDAATEAGLDLNKMLSEVLTQKGGSESLLKSVENLQAQLDSQQRVIDEMTKKLGIKNEENEALQTALDTANDKCESLEEQLGDMKQNLDVHLKDKEELTRDLNSQINQLKTRINQLGESKEKEISRLKKDLEDVGKKLSEAASALTVKEEELKAVKEAVKHLKGKGDVKVESLFDFGRVKGELAKELKEKKVLMERLEKEESTRKGLVEQMNILDGEVQKLRKGYEEAEQKKEEAEKKLEVLSTYFKEKETQLQKELGLQEALWAQKKGDEKTVYNMMKSLQEEVESYKSQNETLKKEIIDQERGLKNQIAILEQKAHENWVAARQAERKLEESKQEMAQLRNRLTLIEKNTTNAEGKPNLRSSEELNGVEAASPILHDTSSPLLFPPLPLDPNTSSLLPPAFMPPPMFMPPPISGFMPPPPFLPGDRRPPPLGRMSSPPLNNRFSPSSPPDYPFERMPSPPLSPPASNYRSPNEERERERYRHRTPPYPPPLHARNWDDGGEMPGFVPISSQRDSRREHKGSNVSSEHSSSDQSLDKSSRHSGRV